MTCEGPARPGPSLSDWAELVRSGVITLPEGTEDLRPEISGLHAKSFASRRLLSQYLSWFFRETVAALPDHVTVTSHPLLVTSLTEHHGADGRGGRRLGRSAGGVAGGRRPRRGAAPGR